MTILDARALDTIARCLDRLTGMSGLNAAECLSALEEFSRPLTPAERVQILVWYDFRDYPVGQVH